ncbi:MAG: hypothetical protein ACSHXK_04210 [Oceanococcus sp.]
MKPSRKVGINFKAAGLVPAFYIAAALSGFAALLFELLLFRRLELVLGRSVSASAVILAAFMLGLGLGAFFMSLPAPTSRWHQRASLVYAGVELFAGVAAAALVFVLPWLALELGNGVAISIAVASLLLPTIAMGMAMPLLCEACLSKPSAFQKAFPRLYAANTLGAMAGAGLGVLLLRQYGIPVASGLALSANVLAAGLVLWLGKRPTVWLSARVAVLEETPETAVDRSHLSFLLVAASGFLILALEVIWLRALLMHYSGNDTLFALVVAVVIGGLSVGASQSRRLDLNAWLQVAAWACVLSCLSLLLWPRELPLLATVLVLALPCSSASGALFSRSMRMLRQQRASSAQASGQLYLINTLMAALGALSAAWVLVPALGIVRAWLLCAASFALLSYFVAPLRKAWSLLSLLLIVGVFYRDPGELWADQALAHFPDHTRQGEIVFAKDASLQLARRDVNGQPVAWRLLTDGYSMSGTEFDSLRYMRLFAQLPQTLHANPQRALLISYGVGTTANALLADQRLQRLDVVDTSQASVALSQEIYAVSGRDSPLQDSRSHLHIDDGRHHLLNSQNVWDIITAEPPPPRLAGVVNLYTQEYFALIYQRLAQGGLSTHWLPVDQLSRDSSAAIIRAFCRVFSDCSLWAGSHYNWVLMGGREFSASAVQAPFPLFRQPQTLGLLREVGFERASQLAATFLADAQQLQAWVGQGPVLDDNHPGRLQHNAADQATLQHYFAWMDDIATQQRLAQSAWTQQLWSQELKQQAEADWLWQPVLNGQVQLDGEAFARSSVAALQMGLRMPVIRLAGLSLAELKAVQAEPAQDWPWHHAIMALVNGDWGRAQQLLYPQQQKRAQALLPWLECLQQGACSALD